MQGEFEMANGKICVNCYAILNNANIVCYYCNEPQIAFYKKEERKQEILQKEFKDVQARQKS